MEKPFKGTLKNWTRVPFDRARAKELYGEEDFGVGYYIIGQFVDHPSFAGQTGNTSWIMSHDEATGEVETRNSRYKLDLASEFK